MRILIEIDEQELMRKVVHHTHNIVDRMVDAVHDRIRDSFTSHKPKKGGKKPNAQIQKRISS